MCSTASGWSWLARVKRAGVAGKAAQIALRGSGPLLKVHLITPNVHLQCSVIQRKLNKIAAAPAFGTSHHSERGSIFSSLFLCLEKCKVKCLVERARILVSFTFMAPCQYLSIVTSMTILLLSLGRICPLTELFIGFLSPFISGHLDPILSDLGHSLAMVEMVLCNKIIFYVTNSDNMH